jgi:hypothetical protein
LALVIYDADTRSLLDNGQPVPSIASNDNLQLNPDGQPTSIKCYRKRKGALVFGRCRDAPQS